MSDNDFEVLENLNYKLVYQLPSKLCFHQVVSDKEYKEVVFLKSKKSTKFSVNVTSWKIKSNYRKGTSSWNRSEVVLSEEEVSAILWVLQFLKLKN